MVGRSGPSPSLAARRGVLLAFGTAAISGLAIYLNSFGVKLVSDAAVYTTAKNGVAAIVLVVARPGPGRRTRGAGAGRPEPARPGRHRDHRRQHPVRPLLQRPGHRHRADGGLHPEDDVHLGRPDGRAAPRRAARAHPGRRPRHAPRRPGAHRAADRDGLGRGRDDDRGGHDPLVDRDRHRQATPHRHLAAAPRGVADGSRPGHPRRLPGRERQARRPRRRSAPRRGCGCSSPAACWPATSRPGSPPFAWLRPRPSPACSSWRRWSPAC